MRPQRLKLNSNMTAVRYIFLVISIGLLHHSYERLYVGKCTAEDLLQGLNILMQKLRLDIGIIICLGMDGPSVQAFERKLNELLEYEGKCLNLLTRALCIQYPIHF